jgi:hypothetical protein
VAVICRGIEYCMDVQIPSVRSVLASVQLCHVCNLQIQWGNFNAFSNAMRNVGNNNP